MARQAELRQLERIAPGPLVHLQGEDRRNQRNQHGAGRVRRRILSKSVAFQESEFGGRREMSGISRFQTARPARSNPGHLRWVLTWVRLPFYS